MVAADDVFLAGVPLLPSIAVWLRFRGPALRWSAAAVLFAALTGVPLWLAQADPASQLSLLYASLVGGGTWGAFFGAALRPFGGRITLAAVASLCVAVLMAIAAVVITANLLGVTIVDIRQAILGTDGYDWGPFP